MFTQAIENMKKFDLAQVNAAVDAGLDTAEKYTKQGLEYVKNSDVRKNLENVYATSFEYTRELIGAGRKLGTMFAKNTEDNLKSFEQSVKSYDFTKFLKV